MAGAGLAVVEGVGVGVDENEGELATHHRGDGVGEPGILAQEVEVRAELGRRVPQPHRRDVAGDHEHGAVVEHLERAGEGPGQGVGKQLASGVAGDGSDRRCAPLGQHGFRKEKARVGPGGRHAGDPVRFRVR